MLQNLTLTRDQFLTQEKMVKGYIKDNMCKIKAILYEKPQDIYHIEL